MATTLGSTSITISSASLSPGGSAGLYPARCWTRFTGTGTVSIYSSGNLSSITDLGTGLYRLNFSTAISDGYCWAGTSDYNKIMSNQSPASLLTTSLQVRSIGVNPNSVSDGAIVSVAVFR